jgi:hypothetical protein
MVGALKETSAKLPLQGFCHLERSAAKLKDQFRPSGKRQTELILRQAQDDGLLGEQVSQRSLKGRPNRGPGLDRPFRAYSFSPFTQGFALGYG